MGSLMRNREVACLEGGAELRRETGYQGIGEGTINKAIFEAAGKPIGPPMPPQRRVSANDLERIKSLLKKYKVFDIR